MRNTAAWCGLGVLAGLLAGFYLGVKNPAAAVAFALACIAAAVPAAVLVKRKKSVPAGAVCIALVFAFAACCYSVSFTALKIGKIKNMSGSYVSFSGHVLDVTDGDSQRVTLYGKVSSSEHSVTTKIQTYINDAGVGVGDKVVLEAKLSDMSYDDISYNYPKGIYAELSGVKIVETSDPSGVFSAYSVIKNFSDSICTKIRTSTGVKAGELLSAMLCGEEPVLSDDLRSDMNRAGIGHVMSVSGLHVCVISAFVYSALKKIGARKYITLVLSEIIMAAFIVFSGMSISSIRAFIMMSIFLFSGIAKREYSPCAALAISVMLITLFNPYAAADPSLLLSITGVFGVSAAADVVIFALNIQNSLLKALVSSVSASLCTLPVSVFFFDEISVISPIANLVFVPICSSALCLCMLFAMTGGAAFAVILVKGAELLADLTIYSCGVLSKLKFTYVPIKYSFIPYVLLAMSAAIAFMYIFGKRNVKRTVMYSAGAYFLTIILIFTASILKRNELLMHVSTYNGEFMCVISTGSSCIVIDSDCSFSDDAQREVNRLGLNKISAAVILSNGVSGFTSYTSKDVVPEVMVFKDSRLADPASKDIDITELEYGGTVSAFGAVVTVYSDELIGISVSGSDKEIFVGKVVPTESTIDATDTSYLSITALDNLTVINDNGDRTILDGQVDRTWVVGETDAN